MIMISLTITFYGILQANISNHYVLFHIRKIINTTKHSDEYKVVRIINQSQTAQYIERIQNTDWFSLNTEKHCQAYFSKYLSMFKNIYDIYIYDIYDSTFMALIILIENMLTALDNGNCAVGIFLDFQKAFDTVDHNMLLDKLHWY